MPQTDEVFEQQSQSAGRQDVAVPDAQAGQPFAGAQYAQAAVQRTVQRRQRFVRALRYRKRPKYRVESDVHRCRDRSVYGQRPDARHVAQRFRELPQTFHIVVTDRQVQRQVPDIVQPGHGPEQTCREVIDLQPLQRHLRD